ncbi:hypothetical protein NA57DRAFT_44742 [Rhizodiscina lignyota]|uniref:Spindle pole body component n=1 Tax=Rhizodiscina lignyota TaxID=1504668 RepID=A0A9P4M3D8_9PEZI|nr:hypothetical protein NA57DRAFT_44742 [Rhizodiscina lignyota]
MPDNIQQRVEHALSQLVEKVVPAYPEDDDQALQDRLDDAYDFAIGVVQDAGDTPLSPDVNHAHDLIKKKLIRDNLGPEKAMRFSNLYSRLLTLPVLQNKWALLYFLFILSEERIPLSLREPSESSPPPEKTGKRDFVVDSPAFNEAFSNAGLLKLPLSEDQKPPRQSDANKAGRNVSERPRPQQAKEEPEAEGPQEEIQYLPMNPSEPALLRDLPFTLQGLSSTNFNFASNKVLKLPQTLPVPIISLLHTLAEPALLYRGLSEFVETSDGGLIGQSLRSALSLELRAYLRLVATLEGQIRSALAKLDENEPRQGIGQAGVTLKRCVVWTREPTMGLRLLSLIVEESKGRKGGEIISLIHSFSLSHGDPFVASFAERLLTHVTRPFYDMLRQWIYDGELSDPYLEFLVLEQQDDHNKGDTDDGRRGAATSVWQDKYQLHERMIPTIITEEFAKKVFLIGKTLNFIRHSCGDAAWVESYSKSASRELRYGDTATLERSIDEAYKTTMARLIHLMVNKFKLLEHLRALKKYILLGAGDFIAVLMESLSSNLDRPANTQYRHTLTAQLEHAVRNSNAQHDDPEVLRRLDARMLELSHGEIGWDVFTLEYKIDAPVDVIVTPFGAKQYLKVFNFLWRVKRVEFALGSTWRRSMTGARGVLASVGDKLGKDWKKARCVLAEMVHFVSQLQYYILFEVIESSWNDLQSALQKPESTLDDLIDAHARYLTAITRKGLLGSTIIDFTSQLHELLKIMLSYKDVVDGLYSFSVAEFTRRQELSAKIETRTAAGKWGITEKDGLDNGDLESPNPDGNGKGKRSAHSTNSPLIPQGLTLHGGAEDDLLPALRQRLALLASDFKARVNVLLGDLIHQPDADMRWLAMVMNFNDVYQPVRRKRKHASEKDKEKSRSQGGAKSEQESSKATPADGVEKATGSGTVKGKEKERPPAKSHG